MPPKQIHELSNDELDKKITNIQGILSRIPFDLNKVGPRKLLKKYTDEKQQRNLTRRRANMPTNVTRRKKPSPKIYDWLAPNYTRSYVYSVGVKDLPSGIPNAGNTCFQDSSLILLYSMEEFRNYIKDTDLSTLELLLKDADKTSGVVKRSKVDQLKEIQKIMKTLFTSMFTNSPSQPKLITELAGLTCRTDATSTQEDAEEAINIMLETIQLPSKDETNSSLLMFGRAPAKSSRNFC